MEHIKFWDHTKNTCDQLTAEDVVGLGPHMGEVCGEVLREDEQSVTVGLIKWKKTDGGNYYEIFWTILKGDIVYRKKCK